MAIGIVIEGRRVLICRRKEDRADAFGGMWEFPGGKCEAGEAPDACVRRELREELAIEVATTDALPVIEHEYPSVWVALHPFVCRMVAGEPHALSAAEWKWVAGPELAGHRFPEANAGLIRGLVDLLGEGT